MNEQLRNTTAQVAPQMSNAARAVTGVFLPIAAIVGAVLFVVWILALVSLVTQQTVFGWALPHGMPLWVGILVLVMVYFAVSAPLKMMRHGGHQAGGYHPGWVRFTASCGLVSPCCSSGSRIPSSREFVSSWTS